MIVVTVWYGISSLDVLALAMYRRTLTLLTRTKLSPTRNIAIIGNISSQANNMSSNTPDLGPLPAAASPNSNQKPESEWQAILSPQQVRIKLF